jgi:hypothetical protein
VEIAAEPSYAVASHRCRIALCSRCGTRLGRATNYNGLVRHGISSIDERFYPVRESGERIHPMRNGAHDVRSRSVAKGGERDD